MSWDFALILLVLGVLVPWRGAARVKKLLAREHISTAGRLVLYASTIAFQWLAVAVVAWRCRAHGWGPSRLALTYSNPELTTATALGLSILLGGIQLISLRRMARSARPRHRPLHQVANKVFPQNPVEKLAFVALVCTVALCEEYLYRGFVFAVFQDASAGSLLAAALGSSLLFSWAHLYQGRRGLSATFVVGLVFAAARIFTSSLAPSIAAHFVTDLAAGLAAPALLADAAKTSHRPAAAPSAAHPGETP